MKKYLLSALALPLLFACSSEDYLDQKAADNDQFAGIAKVDATFSMGEASTMRMATAWSLEEGDVYGFAWLGGGEATELDINGKAWQNHNLTQTNGIFKPATSIYVGNYYIYRPYDETTVNIGAIKFNSLVEQTLRDGQGGDNWKALANSTIIIGDKWTNVTAAGVEDESVDWNWNQPGISQHYKIYAAVFSNQTGLDLTYKKNNPSFAAATAISGATDIAYTYAAGTSVGAADIYGVTVNLAGSANSFTYAPTAEPNTAGHSGTFWADKKNLAAVTAGNPGDGFAFTDGAITLTPEDAETGISTGAEGNKGWFWFNSLPVTAGDGLKTTNVQTVLDTSYGLVTVNKTIDDCAYEYNNFGDEDDPDWQWVKLTDADDLNADPIEWNVGTNSTFVNQYGNHKGKYAFTVDFSTGVLDALHIKNDAHLQKLLKYYIASGKDDVVALLLDKDADGEFKISKISIALLQTINATATKVTVKACTDAAHTPERIVVTQEGQADLGLSAKTEVPALNKVFAVATNVYLSSDYTWTWGSATALTVDEKVTSITNEGTLTVNAANVQLSTEAPLYNAKGATMNITQVTTVKNALTNLGTINVGSTSNTSAELRAYGVAITNDATSLTAYGTINNYGVVGVTAGTTPAGAFNNYGLIDMKIGTAMTLLTANATGDDAFGTAWSDINKMGTVNLPDNNPTAIVSVSDATNSGFIKYTWPAGTTTYATPTGNVKYNTIIVSNDITFTAEEEEIKYIEFNGTQTQVINPSADDKLTQLKGIIVNANKSIIIEMTNIINCSVGAYLGAGATVYKGGQFVYPGGATTNYLGTWSTDQIVQY